MIEIKLEVNNGDIVKEININEANERDVFACVFTLEEMLQEIKDIVKEKIMLRDDEYEK